MDQSSLVSDVSTVISILPVEVNESKPGLVPGEYHIPAVKDPARGFELLHVVRATFPVYIDENRPALIVPTPSDTVAASICRDLKISLSYYEAGVSEPGLFWKFGIINRADVGAKVGPELDRARIMQIEWFKRLVDAADDDYQVYKTHRVISPLQRLACGFLGLKKVWDTDREVTEHLAMSKCKYCRGEIDSDAIICRHCRGIQDVRRYELEYKEAAMGVVPSKSASSLEADFKLPEPKTPSSKA